MKLCVLAENTKSSDAFGAEHGLSLYVEAEREKIIFDFGQGGLFASNALRMGIDLKRAETAVLSHGHYDHGGGISRLLELNPTAAVYVNKYAFGSFRNVAGDYIGIDPALAQNDRVILTDGYIKIAPNIELCTIEAQSGGASGLTEDTPSGRINDSFLHEQYMIIRDKGRKIVFSGCSHKGILNIMESLQPDVFIGGFHLFRHDITEKHRELEVIARRLSEYDTDYYTCHCTGEAQYEFLREIMGDRLRYISSGQTLII